MKQYPFILFISLLMLNSCGYENQNVNAGAKPVVEGYLTVGVPVSIKITKEISYTNSLSGKQLGVEGLTVNITNNGKIYPLKSVGLGVYEADKNLKITAGQSYDLAFDYNGTNISASTTIPSRPQGFKQDADVVTRTKIDLSTGGPPSGGGDLDSELKYYWTNPENDYHFLVLENLEKTPELVIKLPTGIDASAFDAIIKNEPIQGAGTKLRTLQFKYFGNYRVILYKLNPDYALLYKSGNTTSQNIATPASTITNGLGIFTGLNADTLKLLVKKK